MDTQEITEELETQPETQASDISNPRKDNKRVGRKRVAPRDQPKGWETLPADAVAPDRSQNNASRADEIGGNVTVTGQRTRKPPSRPGFVVPDESYGFYVQSFLAQLYPTALSAAQMSETPRYKKHRNELPAAPNHFKNLKTHPYGREFLTAC